MEHIKFVNMVTKAISELEVQGELSKTDSGGCLYHQKKSDGTVLCCIVGHMMQNESIQKEADNWEFDSSITTLYDEGFPWTTQFNDEQIEMLTHLQYHHDNIRNEWTFQEIISKMYTLIADYDIHVRGRN
jgi:hypothetical protein